MTKEEREHQEYISAAAAVYAWMCAADGNITKAEISGFVEYLNSLEYVDEITNDDFSEAYLALLEAFENDYDDGVARAQSRIETFCGDIEKSKDLVRVARKALIADGAWQEGEEAVMNQITNLLGIDEAQL